MILLTLKKLLTTGGESTPTRWPSLLARAKNHGRIPLRTTSHFRNSSRPAALRAVGRGIVSLQIVGKQ